MTTPDQVANELVAYIAARVNVTLGTRDDIRKFLAKKLSQGVAPEQGKMSFEDITSNKHGGNPESTDAFKKASEHQDEDKRRIYWFVRDRGEVGATAHEISRGTGIKYQTVSGRCGDLKRDGMLRKSGRRRPTDTGAAAAVLVVC